jgi:nitroimidazol reductase NimA-like FMN-containing flavoprotein (pyridoxamine 5'-phosphate oxidase superfamily)
MARSKLRMTDGELGRFLAEERVLRLAVVDEEGWPHVVPLWFVWRDGRFWVDNLDRSKRTRLLEAGAKAGLVVDAGEHYGELRGASCRITARFVDDAEDTVAVRADFARKYLGSDEPMPLMRSHTWLELTPVDAVASWDFAKMAGPA